LKTLKRRILSQCSRLFSFSEQWRISEVGGWDLSGAHSRLIGAVSGGIFWIF
jgi:hypothetical protein